MTVPAPGEFTVTTSRDGIAITCPACGGGPTWDWTRNDKPPTMRDLIAAASAHATTHARAEINA